MKKALIFHGTGGSAQGNWFPWLKHELEERGYQVAVPQFPDADTPNFEKWLNTLEEYQEYNWPENKIIGWKSVPRSTYLIVEGCSLLHPDLISFYDYSIWIDFPLEDATARGMARDRSWGVDHDELWRTVWMPNEQDFFNKHQPNRIANFSYKPQEEL